MKSLGYQVQRPLLNYDILVKLFALLGRKDISSLMKTCKNLYRPAIPYILDGEIMVWGLSKTISFCRFMLAKPWNEYRNRHLLRLSIYPEFPPDEEYEHSAFALARTIQRAVHLEELQISSVDSVLNVGGNRAFEALRDLSSLHKLKKLVVQEIEAETVRLLGAMVSNSITDLSLSYHCEMESPDPLPALQSLCSTITTLDLAWVDLVSLPVTVQCPLVQKLSLRTFNPITTAALLHAFPNLLRFSLFKESDFSTDADIVHQRQRNRADLAPPHPSWTRLRHLDGDITQLYALGLSCPVYEVSVENVTIRDAPRLLRLFIDLLPQMVELEINLTSRHSLQMFGNSLQATLILLNVCCSRLSLRICLGKPGGVSNIQGLMSTLVSCLRRTMVRLLEIQFEYTRKTVLCSHPDEGQDMLSTEATPQLADNTAEANSSGDREMAESVASDSSFQLRYPIRYVNAPDPVGEYLESMDIQSFALQIARQAPILEHVGVEISVCGAPQMYWEVIRSSGSNRVSLSSVGDFWDGHRRYWQAAEEMGE